MGDVTLKAEGHVGRSPWDRTSIFEMPAHFLTHRHGTAATRYSSVGRKLQIGDWDIADERFSTLSCSGQVKFMPQHSGVVERVHSKHFYHRTMNSRHSELLVVSPLEVSRVIGDLGSQNAKAVSGAGTRTHSITGAVTTSLLGES